MRYFLVHDLGTTGNKAALFDESGGLHASSHASYETMDCGDGGFEQNPADWLQAVAESTRQLIESSDVSPSQIEGVSFSGHMMGVVALDDSLLPLRPAILHSDIRSRPQMLQVLEKCGRSRVHQLGGNPLDVHYPWLKIAWLRYTEPENYKATQLFVQSKDYVAGWLTGTRPVTDYSDASLYGCFDFRAMNWSDELCSAAGIAASKLPRIVSAGERLGGVSEAAAKLTGLATGTPVYAGFGDGASAALGSGSYRPGAHYCYVGSTAWVSGTTSKAVIDPEGRLFTLALTRDRFALLGTVQSAGSAWDWAVTRLCEAHFDGAEASASASPPGSRALVFLPYLTGERAPIWNDNARGVWFGLSSSHSVSNMLRSVLEGVGLALSSVLHELRRCLAQEPGKVRLIGGGVRTELLRQILVSAFACNTEVSPDLVHATARGAMMAAAVGSGVVDSFEMASAKLAPIGEVVTPDPALAALYESVLPLVRDLYEAIEPAFESLAAHRQRLGVEDHQDAAL